METENYVAKLNEHAQKTRSELRYEDVGSDGPDHNKKFTLKVFFNGKHYPDGEGKNKKEAKQKAAKNALRVLLEESLNSTGEQKSSVSSSPQEEEINQNVSEICDKFKNLKVNSLAETNFIGLINQYCQRTKSSHDYIQEKRCGPSHNPQFFYKLVINKKHYPVAEGKSVKEAKQKAAQLAWSALQEQSESDSKGSSAVFDDLSPSRHSTPVKILESSDMKLVRSPRDQFQSPDVKPKIRIAANFKNSLRNSKEDMANFNGKTTESSQTEKTTSKSVTSRFTTEYDSIVCLGKGAFGHVFKAKQKLLLKDFAIKIVRCKEKALREVEALSDLFHPNIVRYHTCWLDDSGYQWDSAADSYSSSQSTGDLSFKFLYIQMELCDTKTLRVWIDEKNTQNVKKSLRNSKRREEGLSIAKQIVCGVEYIHSKNFIHRDLKPANIMFGQDGKMKIGDFGLVTAENNDDAENLVERTVYKGTPSYMAPEQKSRSIYDRKVDIFALGLIYFELLWNVPAPERKVIWNDVRNQMLPQQFAHNFPFENQIIKSMLCMKPEARPEASKLKIDLEECTRVLETLKDMRHASRTV